jgi:hypothetical protein
MLRLEITLYSIEVSWFFEFSYPSKGLCHLIDKERATYVKKREALLQREAL